MSKKTTRLSNHTGGRDVICIRFVTLDRRASNVENAMAAVVRELIQLMEMYGATKSIVNEVAL